MGGCGPIYLSSLSLFNGCGGGGKVGAFFELKLTGIMGSSETAENFGNLVLERFNLLPGFVEVFEQKRIHDILGT